MALLKIQWGAFKTGTQGTREKYSLSDLQIFYAYDDLQIFLRMRPAAILLHGAAGAGWSGQWGSPKEVRASGAPLRQAAEGRRPQLYMLAPKRPTPVRRRFKVTHSLRGRSAPGGMFVPGGMVSCTGFISSPANHVSIAPLGWSWSLLGMLLGGWRVDERVSVVGRGFGLLQCRHVKGERCLVLRAFLISVDVWCSLRSAGGAIPESTGRYITGVGRRQPLTIPMLSVRVTSRFFFYVVAPASCWGSIIFCSAIDECEGACSESKYVCELPRKNQQDDVEGYSLTPLCHVVPQCAVWRWVVCPVLP